MTTMTETDWDPLNDDLGYGRHTTWGPNQLDPRRDGALTVEDILKRLADERWSADHPDPMFQHNDDFAVTLKPYRPNQKGVPADPDATVGFLPLRTPVVRPRPGPWLIGNAEDAAVAALRSRPGWPRESIPMPGEPGFQYDEPPIGHNTGAHPLDMTKVGDFTPVETRVKKLPLWRRLVKQAWHGLFTDKVPEDIR